MVARLRPYPAYRDSVVEWLGKVPEHWEVVQLGRIAVDRCDGPFGSGLKSSHYARDGIRVVRLENIGHGEFRLSEPAFISPDHYSTLGDHSVKAGDVLVAGLGDANHPAGRACVAPGHIGLAMVKADCFRFRLNPSAALPRFVARQLTATAEIASGLLATGATRQRVNLRSMAARRIALPPLPEQTAIARYLDHADARIRRYIRAKEKLIELLEEQKQAIIHQAVTGQIDVRTGQPYPDYKDSGVKWLGKVPKHWETRRLKTLVRAVDRRTSTGDETLLSLRRDHGVVIYSEHFARPPQGKTLVGYKLVAEGQLVVNRMQANNGLVFCSRVEGVVSPDYSVFEMKVPLQGEFLSDLLRTSLYRAQFRRVSTGLGTGTAGFLRLYDDAFLATAVCVPPEEEQIFILRSLANEAANIDRLIDRRQRELQLIKEYRTRLIADVVTGKLDVRDAALHLPKVDSFAGGNRVGATQTESNTHTTEYGVAKEAHP